MHLRQMIIHLILVHHGKWPIPSHRRFFALSVSIFQTFNFLSVTSKVSNLPPSCFLPPATGKYFHCRRSEMAGKILFNMTGPGRKKKRERQTDRQMFLLTQEQSLM